MPGDFPIQDPQKIWQNQSTEPLKMSATELRHRALQRQSRDRFEARFIALIGLVLSVFFAWIFTRAHGAVARTGWSLLSLWGVYAAWQARKWIWPRNLPEDAPITTCFEFYRDELERRRDYLRHRWWRSGLPVALLGTALAVVGTGAQTAQPGSALSFLPLFLFLAAWVVTFPIIRKKLGQENLEQEIAELQTFGRENRS